MNISGLGTGWDSNCAQCGRTFRCFSTKQNVCSTQCRFDFYRGKKEDAFCWEWTGPRLKDQGYGVLFLNQNRENGRRMVASAHRYAYTSEVGVIPDDLCVMHTCDNPPCTNPAHLRVGTRGENNSDRSKKGRSSSREFTADDRERYSKRFRGEGSGTAKLTEEQARFIKYERTMPIKEIVAKLGISKTTVGHIRCGRAWKHI